MCVHICPVLVILMLLLFDGLVERLLVELCFRWSSADDVKINQNENDDLPAALRMLILASTAIVLSGEQNACKKVLEEWFLYFQWEWGCEPTASPLL